MNERIGPYVVDRRIGMGGMGIVYAAHDEALDRRVALKVISPQLADDAEFRARFVREARAMAALDSPHVVSVFAHGETDGQLWMATRYFPDGDLGTLLRRSGPPQLIDAIELMAQVADGLAAAHAVGLVHRDIKPANVLLRRSGLVWSAALADFGIARAGSDQTGLTQGGMVGTPSFMAPELHTGGTATPASDLYSMGCLLWTTVAGTAPYPGTTDYEVVSAHLEQPVPQLDGTSALVVGVNAVLQRAMAKDPARRTGSASELRDELRALLRAAEHGPTAVRRAPSAAAPAGRPTPTPKPAPTARRRQPAVLAAAGVVVLALLGVVLWQVWPESAPDPAARTADPSPSASESAPTSPAPETPPASPAESPSTPAEGGATTPEPSSADGFTAADRDLATEGFVAALVTQPAFTADTADCVATEVLAGDGLQRMVEAGYFDASWTYVDQDLAPYPEIQAAFTSAAFSCAVAG